MTGFIWSDILFIIGFSFLVYARTLKFYVNVDDIRRIQHINEGFFNCRQFIYKALPRLLSRRLYGCGTFARRIICKCNGEEIGSKPKEDCSQCHGKGYFWRWSIPQDHLFTIILHTTASVLIYLAFGKNNISFMASLLYCVNPINNQTAIWLNGRRYLLNVIIVLLMVLSPWGLIAFPFSAMFQVTAIFAPLLFGWKMIPLIGIPIFFAWGHIRRQIILRMRSDTNPERMAIKPQRLIMVIKHYGHFFFKMIFSGVTLMIYPGDYYYWGQKERGNKEAYSFSFEFWRGVLAIVLTGLLPFFLPKSMFWMWVVMVLSTLQWCAILPITQDMADRYASVPTVFMMVFLMTLFPQAFPFLLGAYLVQLNISMKMYPSLYEYWRYQEYFAPNISRPRAFKVNWLLKRNDLPEAFSEVQKGLKVCPDDYQFLKQACAISHGFGQVDQARKFLNVAARNIPFGREEEGETELKQLGAFIDNLEKQQKWLAKQNVHPAHGQGKKNKKRRF